MARVTLDDEEDLLIVTLKGAEVRLWNVSETARSPGDATAYVTVTTESGCNAANYSLIDDVKQSTIYCLPIHIVSELVEDD